LQISSHGFSSLTLYVKFPHFAACRQ
jgi:hypothetical protein